MPPGLKLTLKTGSNNGHPATPSTQTPSTGGGLKLKLSQPPTPATEQTSSSMVPSYGDLGKKPRNKPSAKKRAAEYDDYDDETPAPKRLAPESRKSSIVLKTSKKSSAAGPAATGLATPSSAGPRISLKKKRQPSAPVLRRLNVKGRVPDRAPGNAYDSEDSDREKDPATEQQLILRMEPGEDADYLRDAITNKTIGVPPKEGGAEVTIRFVEREFRRAVITIKGRMYGAVLVDLPCIVETMKSWDKKGWWKVADIHQMLLVLGRCNSDEEAKNMPLPRGTVHPSNFQYAHGLTPPMHWVRKRRFRKRLSYKDTANIEEEVQKLLEEDEKAERDGGETNFEILNRESIERSVEPEYFDEDADGEAVSTIEDAYDREQQEEMDAAAAEAELQGLFDMDDEVEPQAMTSETITASPANLADSSASLAQVQAGMDSVAATPAAAETSAPSSDEDESDEDEDEEEDDIDVVDEDAAMKAAERAQQMEEINDLEREVEIQRQKLAGQKNQLLRDKTMKQLRSLEEDLRIKKGGLGMQDEDDDDEE
jgi:transcription initiation factor TFIID subunit 7